MPEHGYTAELPHCLALIEPLADDDDDLLSLDFTVPGAFAPAPGPAVAPAPQAPVAPVPLALVPEPPAAKFELSLEPLEFAAPEAVPVPESPVAAKPSRRALPPALVEASRMYAAGEETDALKRLETALKSNENIGAFALQVWAGLFDLLQVLDRRAAFDALALAFAKHFEKSPPAWSGGAADGTEVSSSTGGRAHVGFSGTLGTNVGEALKHVMKLAQTSSMVRLDLAKLADADNDGCTLMLRAIAALKKAKKEFVLGAPEHLAGILQAKLEVGTPANESMWMLLLELYQQAYRQDLFDDAAVNYAVTFEVSPPSWVVPSAPSAAATEPPPPPPAPKGEGFMLRGQLLGAAPNEFSALEAAVAERSEFVLDARNLVRIDAVSTQSLLEVLTRLAQAGKKIRIAGLSALVAAYLETAGFSDVAELRTRAI